MPDPTITILAHHQPHAHLHRNVLNTYATLTNLCLTDVRIDIAPSTDITTLTHHPKRSYLIIDTNLERTLETLERMSADQRARSSILTDRTHPLALDTLGSTHAQHVITIDLAHPPRGHEALELLHAATAAATSTKAYRFHSGEPYQALRVLQRVARNYTLDQISNHLNISRATIMSHLSNTLARQALNHMDELHDALHRTLTSPTTATPPEHEPNTAPRPSASA